MRVLALVLSARVVVAEPLRLRGDVYSFSPSPAGLVVLQGEDLAKPWVQAEGLAWLGSANDGSGDVLTLSVRLRDPRGHGDLRVGRFVASAGAVRPIHLDGATAIVRAPTGTTLETFAGIPVVPRFRSRAYDWAIGGRIAQSIAQRGSIGVSYVQQRDFGRVANEEVGADAAATFGRSIDVAARAAYDLTTFGLSDALVSVGTKIRANRFELFATERSPSRMLPATSIFSVFGDSPSTRLGTSAKFRLAPRLELLGTAAAQRSNDRLGHDLLARATLRTDDDGIGYVGFEVRRQAVGDTRWAGARAFAYLPLVRALRASTELELVYLEGGAYAGSVRPWGLVALSLRQSDRWTFSAGAEAASTNTARAELNALLRASYSWERP